MTRQPLVKFDQASTSKAIELAKHKLQSELRDRSPLEIYELCFSRLTKPDPQSFVPAEDRTGKTVLMLGTDQRDLFAPVLLKEAAHIRDGARILDIGCGDGQTSCLLWRKISTSCSITLLDPNEAYLDAHKKVLSVIENINVTDTVAIPVDEWLLALPQDRTNTTGDETFDLILLLHAIYFTKHPITLLDSVIERLSKNGRFIVIFADELSGYTGTLLREYVRGNEDRKTMKSYADRIGARHKIFGIGDSKISSARSTAALRKALGRNDFRITFASKQGSRIYGNDFGDLIASAFITGLDQIGRGELSQKVEFVANILREQPASVQLSLETRGVRKRMLSVSQPQYVFVIEKSGA